MRIAYIVTAYKNPDQAVRLIRALDAGDVDFFIHVDTKTNESVHAWIVDPLAGLPHVHFLQRHRCDWGGFGHVKATLKGITEIVRTNELAVLELHVVLREGPRFFVPPISGK